MNKIKYNEKIKPILDSLLLDISIVEPGKMYGYPAYYVKGKLFASLYNDGVCLKIPEKKVKELLKKEEYHLFEPMGRKMREWIFIVKDNPKDYINYKELFFESIEFVSSIANNKYKKK